MALTRNKPRVYSTVQRRNALALAVGATVFEGSAVGIDAATGRVRPLVNGDVFAGFATAGATAVRDVSGASPTAALMVADGEVQLAVAGVVAANVGASVFATDDDTFSLSGTSLVGEVMRVPTSGQAVVAFVGGRQRASSSEVSAVKAMVLAANVGGSGTYTREQLRLLAEANGLVPGATYRTTEGVVAVAVTNRYLKSDNWFSQGARWAVGSATAWRNLFSFMAPPIGPNGRVATEISGALTSSTRTKRICVTIGGTLTDNPGTAGVNENIWDRSLTTAGQVDFELVSRLRRIGSQALVRARAVGNSSDGISSSTSSKSRDLALDLDSSKLVRVAGYTTATGTDVTITGLQISGGYAYGTVAGGTFTDKALVRTAKISGATEAAFNTTAVDIELLTTGLPSPVVAAVGTATEALTLFRYPVASGSGSATGLPVLRLFDDLVVESFTCAIDPGTSA